MMAAARTIALSLVSHTNVGKTTLARTLLGRDVGEIRDEAHVTGEADRFPMLETPQGDRLLLWDTPGFGDSARLARRLRGSAEPIAWLIGEGWDRFRDRALWSSQQAVRNVRDEADVVLYLVNASEPPSEAGHVHAEMQVLDWIGKPVIVLLNQLGPPRPAADDEAELAAWRNELASTHSVRAVLPLDAFARCWVQEATLLEAIEPVLPDEPRAAFGRLRREWMRRRRATFDAAIDELAARLAAMALDREPLPESGVRERLRALAGAREAAGGARALAMRRLAARLEAGIRAATDRLIELHGLHGHATQEILDRLAEHYAIDERVDEGKAAAFGGVVTGALAGLKADIASGGLTFGAGVLAGSIAGALGGFGLARGYNFVRGAGPPTVTWSPAALDDAVRAALLAYLAVAHYGRGRGDWTPSEHPPHWPQVVDEALAAQRDEWSRIWDGRAAARGAEGQAALRTAIAPALRKTAADVLARLYPQSAAALAPANGGAAD